jgi:hypothetical protein
MNLSKLFPGTYAADANVPAVALARKKRRIVD